MMKLQTFDYKCDYFIAREHQNLVFIKLKKHLMLYSTNLVFRDTIIEFLDLIRKSDKIKVVVIMSHFDSSICKDYIEFYDRVFHAKLFQGDVLRMCRTLDQIMLAIVESNKFFISANSGKLFPEAIGLDLACDYRIISDDTTFQNIFLEYENIPKGGITYFLDKRLGHCKATELLLTHQNICARKALSLGLVNKVVPIQEIESKAIEKAKHFAKKPIKTLSGLKNLLNYSMKDLAEYLEFENQELIRIIRPFSIDSINTFR